MIDPISWEFSYPFILSALFWGYFLGSIPFGLLLTRLGGHRDIRQIGSGNIGATNVLRTGNKCLAAATLLLDAGKGAIAVLVAAKFGPDIEIVAALGALIGHVFPVWLRFKGGKGVATSLGLLFALTWPIAFCALAVWIIVAAATRYSSLGALTSSLSCPILAWFISTPQITEFYSVMALLIWFKHLSNIKRLLKGEETKIGVKKL